NDFEAAANEGLSSPRCDYKPDGRRVTAGAADEPAGTFAHAGCVEPGMTAATPAPASEIIDAPVQILWSEMTRQLARARLLARLRPSGQTVIRLLSPAAIALLLSATLAGVLLALVVGVVAARYAHAYVCLVRRGRQVGPYVVGIGEQGLVFSTLDNAYGMPWDGFIGVARGRGAWGLAVSPRAGALLAREALSADAQALIRRKLADCR